MKLRIAPTEEWDDAPLAITMQVSSAWISVVINELLWLTNERVWDGDLTEQQRASQAIQNIIEALSNESELGGIVEVGTIIQSGADTPPAGYLTCDGSAVDRTTYSALFAAIGTKFGSGNGTTTFNIPDMRNKFTKGANSESERGSTGGDSTVTLTEAQMPAHSHTLAVIAAGGATPLVAVQLGGTTLYTNPNSTSVKGSSQAHENEPPYLKLMHFIKY